MQNEAKCSVVFDVNAGYLLPNLVLKPIIIGLLIIYADDTILFVQLRRNQIDKRCIQIAPGSH